MANTHPRFFGVLASLIAIGVLVVAFASCRQNRRLVEVFDNGPVGGPAGASEGYIWVGSDDLPPPGKTWGPVDPEKLTPEQRTRIR